MAIGDTDVELEFTNVAANVPIVVGIQNTGVDVEVIVRFSPVKYPATLGVDYSLIFPVDLLTFQFTPTQSLIDKITATGLDNVVFIQRSLPLTSDFDYDNAFVRQKLVDEFNRVWMVNQQFDYKMGDLQDANDAADAAAISANQAALSASAAHTSELNADISEANALTYSNNALGSKNAAAASATASANSATASQNSAVASAASAADAANSAAISTQKVSKVGDTMTGPLNLPAGAVNNPSLQFGTGNSGFYATGTGASAVLKAEVNAVDKLAVDANAVTPSVPLRAANGAVGAPSLSFTSEVTAGFYRAGAGDIRFAMNGADVVKWLNDKSETHFGPIVLPADPTTALQAATKQYVDATAAALPNPTPTTKGGVKSYGPVVNQFLKSISTSGDVTSALIGPTDLPDPTASTKGGVKAIAPVGGSFMTSIGTDGTPTLAPATSGPPPAPSAGILGGVFSKAPVAGQYVNGVDTAGNVLTTALVAADILTPLKTVDGTGSGLDADLLDGLDSTAFATAANAANKVLKAGDTMTGPLVMPATGTAAATSFNFGTAGTGLFGTATAVNISVSGVNKLGVASSAIVPFVPTQAPDGGVTTPSYSWLNDNTSGFYRAAAGDVRLSMGGNDVVKFLSSNKTATFTGEAILVNSTPSTALTAASKGYVDAGDAIAYAGMVPTGSILPYAGFSAPAGFYLCTGQNISRAANPKLTALFAGLSPAFPFGAGDGSTTMGTPDLRGRTPFGVDNMGGLGAAGRIGAGLTGGMSGGVLLAGFGGEGSHQPIATEQVNHIHSHNHGPQGGTNFVRSVSGGNLVNNAAGTLWAITATTDTDSSGPNVAFNSSFVNNMPPALVVGYIIAGG